MDSSALAPKRKPVISSANFDRNGYSVNISQSDRIFRQSQAYTEETKQQRKLQIAEEMREAAGEDEQELAVMADAFLKENLPENVFGAPKARDGMWASCIRVLDPISGETVQQFNLEQNEAALRYTQLDLQGLCTLEQK